LVSRHPSKKAYFYDVLLHWLERHYPHLRTRFELGLLTRSVQDWKRYVLHVPWLQDPVQAWSPTAYAQAVRLTRECDARNIPTVNRVEQLTHAGKQEGARRIAAIGIRTAKMVRISDPKEFRATRCGLNLPLFVREDWRHGGPIFRADSDKQCRQIPLARLRRPVAVEYIDVQDPRDGLYRKYRCLAAGEIGIPVSMHPCRTWHAKGWNTEFNAELRDEELAFLSQPDPNHPRLEAARQALGLDLVAFDYSYDHEGQLVVWEANPFPHIQFGTPHRQYRWPAVARALAGMTRLYFSRAGLAIPAELDELLQPCTGNLTRAA
jgi:hypothetical protein